MTDKLEEIRRAVQAIADAREKSESEEFLAKKAAANDLQNVWLDALERSVARGETGVYLRCDDFYDLSEYQLELITERAPKFLGQVTTFWLHSMEYNLAYAAELERLLGPPFKVGFGTRRSPEKRDHWRQGVVILVREYQC